MMMMVLDMGMLSMSFSVDDRVESIFVIGFVFDGSDGTIGLVEGVLSFYFVSVTFFVLLVDVVVVRIVYGIFVFVVRFSLEKMMSILNGIQSFLEW